MKKKQKQRNPVAQHAHKFNQCKCIDKNDKYQRNQKHKKLEPSLKVA